MKIKLNSHKDTKKEDLIFIVEKPSVNREKVRMADVLRELNDISSEKSRLVAREKELKEIKLAVEDELKKI